MRGVSAKDTVLRPFPASDSLTAGVLETAVRLDGTVMETWKVALRAGSSQQGSARRASVASNWVVARYCPLSFGVLVAAAVETL